VPAVEQRALTLITQRPGVTVAELRDALAVGSTRVWQIVAHLEWLGVLHRNGAPARRLGPRQPRLPLASELLVPDAPTHLRTQHQVLTTMLIFGQLASAPRGVLVPAEVIGPTNRTIRRLLARLEHDELRHRRSRPAIVGLEGMGLPHRAMSSGARYAPSSRDRSHEASLQCYTAARTIAVLIHLAAGLRSAIELEELLDLARPTARRILAMLTHGGYVDRVPGETPVGKGSQRLMADTCN
jgi:predicted transcriptional regulator